MPSDHSSDFTRRPYSKPLIPKGLKWLSEAQQRMRDEARAEELGGMTWGELRERDLRCDLCGGRGADTTLEGLPFHSLCLSDDSHGRMDGDFYKGE